MTERTRISLLMPTRERPELARRFLRSVLATAQHPEAVEVIMYVDEDDKESHALDCPGLEVIRIIGPRQSMGGYNMGCLAQARGEIIMLMNDDVVIRTAGWDETLRRLDASVPDRIYLAYGNDLFKGQKLCTFPILPRRVCEVLREPFHRAYRGAFIDYHLMDIFKRLERHGKSRIFYLSDLVFEHLHYRTGKAAFDTTYGARGRFEDDMLFVGLAPVRAASLGLLEAAIDGSAAPAPALPHYTPLRRPRSLIHAFGLFTRLLLMDRDLPAKWRFFMWWWFSARYVAGNISKQPVMPGGAE
ncbi:MAG TPA: hypothetical protein PLY97_05245 [Acidocella sp.]|nr:MAG: hypothetical protein B7Z80_23105 [Rhodospirillales bacterium 20-64-7]HQT46610.1 hypothetical protein [Acidocella sp.]